MNRQQQDNLSALIRERDTKGVLDLLGGSYDFTTDEAGVVNAATWYGDIALLRHALDSGGSARNEGMNGHPLGIASAMGRLDFVALLLERDAPIDAKNSHGQTALVLAASAGKLPVVKALVKRGAKLTGALYAASEALHVPLVKYLIEVGADLDEVSEDGNELTPLLTACSRGKKKGSEIALLLLRAGARADYVRQDDGMSAIKFALWGQCSKDVLAELQVRGSPTIEPGFPIIRLV
ncbi:ankyrin repeat domain-containing protein [Xenophilus aerolatus]|nr:ankyrin repeat domain-containing protein [Xenophilus aerolatus]